MFPVGFSMSEVQVNGICSAGNHCNKIKGSGMVQEGSFTLPRVFTDNRWLRLSCCGLMPSHFKSIANGRYRSNLPRLGFLEEN